MTHQNAGKYAAKHRPGTARNEQIAQAIREKSQGRELSCAMAEKISKDLSVGIAEVGLTADLLEIKIKQCQLGLFGWGDKPGHGKDIQAIDSVPLEIKGAVEKAAVSGAVTCVALWTIAHKFGVKRKEVSTACDTLGIKIRECQLGTF